MMLWFIVVAWIYSANAFYFPHSFFAEAFLPYLYLNEIFFMLVSSVLLVITALAYWQSFGIKHRYKLGSVLMGVTLISVSAGIFIDPEKQTGKNKPNVIMIGIDSLRPDFTGYFGNKKTVTPNIDKFFKAATVYTNAYTPLSRTFPSWVGVLTAKYPLHNMARANLVDQASIATNETIGKRLQQDGYFTIYGSDEPRFTDITAAYGFDRILGPKGGAVEFVLSGLSDFPLNNLWVNLPIGRLLFPYNFGNRSADITYVPENFLKLVKVGLSHRPDKPVFMAIHLCLPHWPWQWAQDGLNAQSTVNERYIASIEAADKQLGSLLEILKNAGLLDKAIVVLLSDHGVALGQRGDRLITEENYRGKISPNRVNKGKLSSAQSSTLNVKRDFTFSTSFGQGNDVLSLTQNHIILAFKGYGTYIPIKQNNNFTINFDIAPILLNYLYLDPMKDVDGMASSEGQPRPFYIETGDKIEATETKDIDQAKVLSEGVSGYRIDLHNGLVVLTSNTLAKIIRAKQRAVIWKGWILAKYPETEVFDLVPNKKVGTKMLPPYYILVNLKTGLWTIDFSSPLAKSAPVAELKQKLKEFYGSEL
jgi:arylsulfatase A-like enzyme